MVEENRRIGLEVNKHQQKNRLLLDTENLKAHIITADNKFHKFRKVNKHAQNQDSLTTVQQTMAKRERSYFNNLAVMETII